jgi:hypothetical protein
MKVPDEMHDEFQGVQSLGPWQRSVPEFGDEILDLRHDAVTTGAVARCIVSRRADRDIDEMPRRRLAMLRPDLIGPTRDIGERGRVFDIEKLMDVPSCFRFETLFGNFSDDAVTFRAPGECASRDERQKDQGDC